MWQGVIQHQVAARIWLEYFSIGHPPLLHTRSPTVLITL